MTDVGNVCFCCSEPTDGALDCGHTYCEKCEKNLQAMAKVAGIEKLCVVCYNKKQRKKLGEDEMKKLVEMIKREVEMNEIEGDERMKRMEEQEAEIEKKGEEIKQAVKNEGEKCKQAIANMLARQRGLEEKRLMGFALAEDIAQAVAKVGNVGFLMRMLEVVNRLSSQRPGMQVRVEGRSVAVEDLSWEIKEVTWGDDASKWACHETNFPAGFMVKENGGAVFDPVRRLIIENSSKVSFGRDIFVTRLGDDWCGTNDVVKGVIPFNVMCNPAYDNERFLYFHEFDAGGSNKFGRLDLETMSFEMLASPQGKYNARGSFFMDGSVFCFDRNNRAMRYDCASGVWNSTSLIIDGKYMVPHPWQNGRVIELLNDGGVREVRVADGRVVKTYTTKYGWIEGRPEMIALRASFGAFLLLVCDGRDRQLWRVFSSAADNWTETDWPTTGEQLNSAVFVPEIQSVLYHRKGENNWISVTLDQKQNPGSSLATRKKRSRRPCVSCGAVPSTVKLSCGHKYCDACTETFTAYSLLEKMARGYFEADIAMGTECVVCAHRSGKEITVDTAELIKQVVDAACSAREHDWEGAFDDMLRTVDKTVAESVSGVDAEMTAAVAVVRAARDKEFALQKERRAVLHVVNDLVSELGERAGVLLKESALLTKKFAAEIVCTVIEATEDRSIAAREFSGHGKIAVRDQEIQMWKSSLSEVPTILECQRSKRAVFDPVRRIIFEVTDCSRTDTGIFGVRPGYNGKWNVASKWTVPFPVRNQPVFDNERFVYFQESSKKQFGRLNLNTLKFEKLADAPRNFDKLRGGFFSDSSIFCFDNNKKAMLYDSESDSWSDASYLTVDKRMVPHPWKNGVVIELVDDGGVREVRVADGQILKTYNSNYGSSGLSFEMLALCAPDGAFFLLVCDAMNKRPWRVFSSATDSWTDRDWPMTVEDSCTAFFDPNTGRVLYYVNDLRNWTALSL